ncbi:MAG: hypothetical protein WCJ07_09115 [Verrucomicrobiota bacterium]
MGRQKKSNSWEDADEQDEASRINRGAKVEQKAKADQKSKADADDSDFVCGGVVAGHDWDVVADESGASPRPVLIVGYLCRVVFSQP